jgi:hypothetical protein
MSLLCAGKSRLTLAPNRQLSLNVSCGRNDARARGKPFLRSFIGCRAYQVAFACAFDRSFTSFQGVQRDDQLTDSTARIAVARCCLVRFGFSSQVQRPFKNGSRVPYVPFQRRLAVSTLPTANVPLGCLKGASIPPWRMPRQRRGTSRRPRPRAL